MALLLLFSAAQSYSGEARMKVDMATDLESVSQQALQAKLPVLMFFASTDCEFCEMLEEDHLASMAHSAGYKDKVIIRKINIDDYDSFRDFDGQNVSADEFSERFAIKVTPTLVFVNHKGTQVAKKMLGYNRSDFFSVYLDEAIDNARTQVQ